MTVKWLWSVAGGAQVETVLMRYRDRATVCISSQAGCAMGCTFCATGQAGFDRHLGVGEICEQVLRAQHDSPQRVAQRRLHGHGRTARERRARARVADALAPRRRVLGPPPHGVDGGRRARDAPASGVPASGDARRVAPCARRRAPRRTGAAEPSVSDRRGPRRGPLVRGGEGPPGHLRVRVHPGCERPPAPGRHLGGPAPRVPWRRAREPHSAQSDGRLRGSRGRGRAHRAVRGPAAGARGQRQHPSQSGRRHRRRVRSTPGPTNRPSRARRHHRPQWVRERTPLVQSVATSDAPDRGAAAAT